MERIITAAVVGLIAQVIDGALGNGLLARQSGLRGHLHNLPAQPRSPTSGGERKRPHR